MVTLLQIQAFSTQFPSCKLSNFRQTNPTIRHSDRLREVRLSSDDDDNTPSGSISGTFLERYGTDGLNDYVEQIWSNSGSGEVGKRGEVYFVAQAVIVLCILFGGIPFVGDTANGIAGSVLFFIGGLVIALAINEMGPRLSPWPVVSDEAPIDSGLITTGVFSYVRHPMYAGLLCLSMGFSILTESEARIILTLLLYACLSFKTNFEEDNLLEQIDGYANYRERVRGKFIPYSIAKELDEKDPEN